MTEKPCQGARKTDPFKGVQFWVSPIQHTSVSRHTTSTVPSQQVGLCLASDQWSALCSDCHWNSNCPSWQAPGCQRIAWGSAALRFRVKQEQCIAVTNHTLSSPSQSQRWGSFSFQALFCRWTQKQSGACHKSMQVFNLKQVLHNPAGWVHALSDFRETIMVRAAAEGTQGWKGTSEPCDGINGAFLPWQIALITGSNRTFGCLTRIR